MPKPAEQDRQTRILDAAENAIAELGFAGASLRHIVLEAQVNLATVYYYFGSKRGLMEAVLKRRFGPLREEHLALLREFEPALAQVELLQVSTGPAGHQMHIDRRELVLAHARRELLDLTIDIERQLFATFLRLQFQFQVRRARWRIIACRRYPMSEQSRQAVECGLRRHLCVSILCHAVERAGAGDS